MPPSFDELPLPSKQKITEENEINNIESLINDKKINDEKLENLEPDKDLEKSILDKIKNN